MSTPPIPQTTVSQSGMLSRSPGAKNLPSRPMMMPAMITPMMSTGDSLHRLTTAFSSALPDLRPAEGSIHHGTLAQLRVATPAPDLRSRPAASDRCRAGYLGFPSSAHHRPDPDRQGRPSLPAHPQRLHGPGAVSPRRHHPLRLRHQG